MKKLNIVQKIAWSIIIIGLISLFIFKTIFKAKWNNLNSNKNTEDQTISIELPKTISCARTTRLDNEPQYDRALSLIQQRVEENNNTFKKNGEYEDARFEHFPPELVNCIKIFEGSTSLEGYFTFSNQDTKVDYYPITVSSNYRFTDDVVTGLLLSHEITHVQQYIDTLNGKKALSCIDSEIDAFIAQLDFYVSLNNEEINSVYFRIKSDEDPHPQLKMLNAILTINRESTCGLFDWKCRNANLRSKLREMLTDDSYYKKQCEL